MNELYEDSEFINEFISKHKDIYGSGIITFINGSVSSLDIMPNKMFFNQIFPDLIKSSYQQSLIFKNTSRTYSRFFSTKMLLQELKKTYSNSYNGVGEGLNNSIKSHCIRGDFLSLNDDIIHFYSFPKEIH